MNLNTGNSRLLALLFFFLSYLTICSSIPTKSSAHGSRGLVTKRVDAHYKEFMDDVKKAVNVDQDGEKFMAFGDKPAILASKGFAGCIGAVIAKGNSAIVAHYTDSDRGLSQAEDKLASLINEHKQNLEGGQAWLYAHVRPYKPDVYISEDNNKRLEKVIKDNTGITPVRVKYIEPEDLMEDEQGELKEDEDMPKELLYGAMMVKHSGQPNETPRVIFVNLDWQRAASEGRS